MKKVKKDTLYSLLSLIFVFSAGLLVGFFTDQYMNQSNTAEETTAAYSIKPPYSSPGLEELSPDQPLTYKEWLKEKEFKYDNLFMEDLDQITCQEITDYHQELLKIPAMNYSISYENLITQEIYNHNENELTVVASTSKILTAMIYLDLIEEEKIESDTPVLYAPAYYQDGGGAITSDAGNRSSYPLDKVIEEMIVHSDNTAAMMLKNYYRNNFGNYEKKVQELLGLTEEDISQVDLLWNRLNSRYLKEGLRLAAHDENYDELIQYMLNAEQPFFLSTYVDENIAVKYGQLGASQHDVGIYYIEGEPVYLIAVLTNGLTREQADEFMGRINLNLVTQALYNDYLNTFK